MVFLVPSVELKNQLARAPDPIVQVAVAVVWKRICSKQCRVPATTRPNIAHRYEGLSHDGCFLRREAHECLLLMVTEAGWPDRSVSRSACQAECRQVPGPGPNRSELALPPWPIFWRHALAGDRHRLRSVSRGIIAIVNVAGRR